MNKLVLGTAQFGLDYGINNLNGKPTREKSLEILDFAWQKGIKIFDTAYAYGDAEEILGEFLQNRDFDKEIKIITKLGPHIVSKSKGTMRDIITANLEKSLNRLKQDYVNGYLLHTPEYIRENKIVSVLCDLKKQGLVKNIGVSIYEEADAIYAAKLKEVDYIQIPYNIFDQRLDRTDFFKITKENNVKVFARSPFLQGLILMEEDRIPVHLSEVKKYLRELDVIRSRYNFSRPEVSFLFSFMNPNIDYVVFGVDNTRQLKEYINIVAEKKESFAACRKELASAFVGIKKSIIFPSLWSKKD